MTQVAQSTHLTIVKGHGPSARRLIDAYAYAFVPDEDLNATFVVEDGAHYRYVVVVQITMLQYESGSPSSHIFAGNVVRIEKFNHAAPTISAHSVDGRTQTQERVGHLDLH